MSRKLRISAELCLVMLLFGSSSYAQQSAPADVPKVISYQGLLTSDDGKAMPDGNYQITVSLFSDPAGKNRVWQDNYTTPLSRGVFNLQIGAGTVPLPDAGTMNRPLWVGVQINGSDVMLPLTALTSAPYALNIADGSITADKIARGAVTSDKLGADYVSEVRVNGEKATGQGTVLNITGSGVSYDKQNNSLVIGGTSNAGEKKEERKMLGTDGDWVLTGNSGTNPTTDFVGTTDNVRLEMRVNNSRVMRYDPGATSPNITGGNSANAISGTGVVQGSIIAGGGNSGSPNVITGASILYNIISGGYGNRVGAAGADATANTIAGGVTNIIHGYADFSAIGGGSTNTIDTLADYGVIGGGLNNRILGPDPTNLTGGIDKGTIGGGENNTMAGDHGVIGGGYQNRNDGKYGALSGGYFNAVGGDWSTIGGGDSNDIAAAKKYSFIGGGYYNRNSGEYTVIGGGFRNRASGDYSIVGGGYRNTAAGNYSTIGGGDSNRIDQPSQNSFIGGGHGNVSMGFWTSNPGGLGNQINGNYTSVGGGHKHEATGVAITISGGDSNTVRSVGGSVGGGAGHFIDQNSIYGTIAGGNQNHIYQWVSSSSIAGGYDNNIGQGAASAADLNEYSAIGGGTGNAIAPRASFSTIGGGISNSISVGRSNTISGGAHNTANADWVAIGGGNYNSVTANQSTIGGGDHNSITSVGATIAGGIQSSVTSVGGTIGGGAGHIVNTSSIYGTIAGGNQNQVMSWASNATIGGGFNNRIGVGAAVAADSTSYATISGGSGNVISARARSGAIVGGLANTINSTGLQSTIAGGEFNITQNYGQTVVGVWNRNRGAIVPYRFAFAANANAYNEPQFIVGNGTSVARSNAFEVSYNGHSIVYGQNNGASPAIRGATFTDNVIYAWGEVGSTGARLCGGFGVKKTEQKGLGWYRVTLNVIDPDNADIDLSCASITATLNSNQPPGEYHITNCRTITTSRIGPVGPGPKDIGFDVYISEQVVSAGAQPAPGACCPIITQCKNTDYGFAFKVTGTPKAFPGAIEIPTVQ